MDVLALVFAKASAFLLAGVALENIIHKKAVVVNGFCEKSTNYYLPHRRIGVQIDGV